MAKQANGDGGKLGSLEMRILIEPLDGSEPTDTTTTPSMWANADQWIDSIVYKKPHTRTWVNNKLVQGIYLLAAESEGLVPPDDLSLERIAEFVNLYEVTPLKDDGTPFEDNPKADDDPNGEAPAGEA